MNTPKPLFTALLSLAIVSQPAWGSGNALSDPLLAVDRYRASIVNRVVVTWSPELAGRGLTPERFGERIHALRSDQLLAVSLMSSLSDVLAVADPEAAPEAGMIGYVPIAPCSARVDTGVRDCDLPGDAFALFVMDASGSASTVRVGSTASGPAGEVDVLGYFTTGTAAVMVAVPKANVITGTGAFAGGGDLNTASGDYAVAAGGYANTASGFRSAVGGGVSNAATTDVATVAGGGSNTASGFAATIAGGYGNAAGGGSSFGSIGGGQSNRTNGLHATVAGGNANTAGGQESSVGGGYLNYATGFRASVVGGAGNVAYGENANIGGGFNNQAGGYASYIGGGYFNKALGVRSFVGGGSYNTNHGPYATIGGGGSSSSAMGNIATVAGATIAGGQNNKAGALTDPVGCPGLPSFATHATVSGGLDNVAAGSYATVGGGNGNAANVFSEMGACGASTGFAPTVSGGMLNHATGSYAAIGGGWSNVASGAWATVPGGYSNAASGYNTFAAGSNAKATFGGTFVWADNNSFNFASTATNEFAARATGGVRFVTAINASTGAVTAGVGVAAGGGSWTSLSDRAVKKDVAPVDARAVLARVAAMPLYTWRYLTETSGALHLGPMAQDFRAAFALGDSDRTITTIDADGVALAAIQGLHALLHERDAELARLRHKADEVDVLKRELSAIKAKLGLR